MIANLKDLVGVPCEWLRGTGPECDIVVSSRIRLARNVTEFPFTHRLSGARRIELTRRVQAALKKCPAFMDSLFLKNSSLSNVDNEFLLERHLISQEHARQGQERAVCFTGNEVVSLMVLEEDHLRLQVIQSGFNLTECWRIGRQIDLDLERSLDFAFDAQLGYLTACPTNVGTGLRASCMMHVPALVMTKQVSKVLSALAKLNLATRGLYGEGTQASGNFFQFSNQMTLGQNEEYILDNLERVIKQILDHEREARRVLVGEKRDKLEDQIWRAFGILKTARSISSAEATSLLSLVRLGVDLEILKPLARARLSEIFILTQPAHLQKISDRILNAAERDARRAEFIRSKLKDVTL